MKICPSCREEYLETASRCFHCEKDLLNEGDVGLEASDSTLLSKEEMLNSETVIFTEGPLAQCREFEKILQRANISSVIYPLNLDASATLGATADMKYCMLVRESDAQVAKNAMERHFHDQVVREGRGGPSGDVVDLGQEEVTCPACQETGALIDGECSGCGLTLGVQG